MLKLGITGGIGSGKSTISKVLSLIGVPVYIADEESKKLTATSPIIRQKLIDAFGENLYEGTKLNKALLASYIFNDTEKLKTANKIIHPEVEKHFQEWLVIHKDYPIVGHEAAILFESGLSSLMDKVLMVYAPKEIRIQRVLKRDNTTRQQILDRMDKQMSDEEKAKLSDYVITNDGETSIITQVLYLVDKMNIII